MVDEIGNVDNWREKEQREKSSGLDDSVWPDAFEDPTYVLCRGPVTQGK